MRPIAFTLLTAGFALCGFAVGLSSCGRASSPQEPQGRANGSKDQLNNTGCTCDQVTTTVVQEPAFPLTKPACDSPQARNIFSVGVYDSIAAVTTTPHVWKVAVNGPDDRCCTKVKVGFIQNVLSSKLVYTYSGNGTISGRFVDANGRELSGPRVDSEPKDAPGSAYPYYDRTSVGFAPKCGQTFDLRFKDVPPNLFPISSKIPLEKSGQLLAKVERVVTYRLFLVDECPVGKVRVKKFYDWKLEHSFGVTVVTDPTNKKLAFITPSTYKACATETARQDVPPSGEPTSPVTTGDTANEAAQRDQSFVPTGF